MPGTSVEDMELVARSKSGDVAAFTALVSRYEGRIYNLAYRLVGSADDAADVSQEVFLAAFESIGRFRGESAFYTWLYRIAVNKALAHRRVRDSRPEVSPAGRESSPLDLAVDPADPPEDIMDRRERDAAVQAAIQGLPPDYRAVVVLKDIEGFEYEEIAEIAGIAIGTVKSRLHRARLLLRHALKAFVSTTP